MSDIATDILDPVLRRRAGISVALVQSWDEIVGERVAAGSRPERIAWPRRMSEDDPFEPATLVIACNSFAALHVQHESGEIISRINGFLGFAAIGRIRIVQKPVGAPPKARLRPRELTAAEKTRLAGATREVEDDGLRAALERLGANVIASRGLARNE